MTFTNQFPDNPAMWVVDWPKFGFKHCGVYVISQPSGWPVKIGMSSCGRDRLAAIQTSHWLTMKFHGFWVCDNRKQAREIEQKAHKHLRGIGAELSGEWFDMPAPKANEFIEGLAVKLGIELMTKFPWPDDLDNDPYDRPRMSIVNTMKRELWQRMAKHG